MTVLGIISPGAMGSAVGAAFRRDGARVVATVAGRSERTRGLATAAGLELLPDLDAVVRIADVALSVVPPAEAADVARAIADAARRTDARPLVADLNAVAPATAREIASLLADARLDFVDGSISGPPPRQPGSTRLYLSGPTAGELASVAASELDVRVVGDEIGAASAVKMCTASVYKGQLAVLAQALLAAQALGVLPVVVDDLGTLAGGAHVSIARAVTKARRYVGEMHEIAATQSSVALTPALFEAMAEVYAAFAGSRLGAVDPESIDGASSLEDVLAASRPLPREPEPQTPRH